MEIGRRIILEGLPNTRDLGGYETKSGKVIKMHRLIRSGALYEATMSDIKILTEEYHMTIDVDFRTAQEVMEGPDPVIAGVDYIINPIMREISAGITHEGEKRENRIDVLLGYLEQLGENPMEELAKKYMHFVTDEYSIKQYKKFFDILLENQSGAVLYHCTAGKDRVGTGTALLLSALGVDRTIIIKDYLKTNEHIWDTAMAMKKAAKEAGIKENMIANLKVLTEVQSSYLEAVFDIVDQTYGSMEKYLEDKMGLTKKRIERLQAMYLEG
ncbi:MAG: tyrosine-protein phosphatase [Lachnospiraceae bacterium]